MKEEDTIGDLSKGPSGVIKIMVFAVVGILIITTVAVPILMTIGTSEVSVYNEGTRYTDIADEYNGYYEKYNGNIRLYVNSNENQGIYIQCQIEDTWETVKEYLSYDEIENEQIAMYYFSEAFENITENTTLTYPDVLRDQWGVVEKVNASGVTKYDAGNYLRGQNNSYVSAAYITPHNVNNWKMSHIFIPDPKGDYVMTDTAEGVVCNSPEELYGIDDWVLMLNSSPTTIYDVSVTGSSGSKAYKIDLNGEDTPKTTVITIGTTAITGEMDDRGLYVVESIKNINNRNMDAYFVPYEATYSTNILDGTIIGTLIGLIPMLMIVGLVLYLVSRLKVSSDR